MIDLTGKTALVTGGSRGIGRAIALRLAQAGANVAVNYVSSRQNAELVAERIAELGRDVSVVKADVSEKDDVEDMVRHVGERFGRLDIVVSNAASGGFRPLLLTSEKNFEAAMNTNVRAMIFLAQAATPLLKKSMTQPVAPGRGKIIGLSSHGSHTALPMYGIIGTSKAALESLIRHLALELGDSGINVNVLQAGLVETDSTRRIPNADAVFDGRKTKSMMGDRDLEADDVADAALFLASPLSDLVQGQTLIVDGGAAIHV